MSKVLVTGAAGFIGSNLARLLLDEGREVTVYADVSSGYRRSVGALPRARFVEGEVRDAERLTEAMRGADTVFHLAASVGNKRSIGHPVEDSEVNAVGPLRVLEA